MPPDVSPVHASPHPLRHGSNIGQPYTRRDGILKVTGAARATRGQPSGRDALCGFGRQHHRARPRQLPGRECGKGPSQVLSRS